MKIKGILLLIACVLVSCKSFNKTVKFKDITQVDSLFSCHFRILDSIANNNFVDSTLRCIESINFMETNTSINSSSDGNYFGKTSFTKNDLHKWHDWYILNKDNLFWDKENNQMRLRK